MRLYYHPLSTCSRRVLLVIHHLALTVETVTIDLVNEEQHTSTFLALNPNHKVPVLEDDWFILWESYAIMQYLADLHSSPSIYPSERQARADINRWLFGCGQKFMPGVTILNWENAINSLIGADLGCPTEIARAEGLLREAAQVL